MHVRCLRASPAWQLTSQCNPGLSRLEGDRVARLVGKAKWTGSLRPLPLTRDLLAVAVNGHFAFAHRVGLHRRGAEHVTIAVRMVAHLHDHDVVRLGDRAIVAVGVPCSIPANGVSPRGVAETERVMSDPYLDRVFRGTAWRSSTEGPANRGGFAQLRRTPR